MVGLKFLVCLDGSHIVALVAPTNAPGNLIDHGNGPALLHRHLKTTQKDTLCAFASSGWQVEHTCCGGDKPPFDGE
jgi:hypothetical protein